MRHDGLVLFSGGLDSLLAIKTLQSQGLRVLGVHFTSPFFGGPNLIEEWKDNFDIEIESIDISEDFIKLLSEGPNHGFGKNLNPCRDCKILMLKKLKDLMPKYGAEFLATGEVMGQRPMSQTLDSMNLIEREAGVEGILLRPLSAKNLPETKVEKKGLVNREELLGVSGRSRTKQLKLAREFGIKEEDIPSPAGGCLLTQEELSKRYGKILKDFEKPEVNNFKKTNVGRHYWKENNWLIVGRNKEENEKLVQLQQKEDVLLEMIEPMGPSSLLTNTKGENSEKIAQEAAGITAFFSPKAKQQGEAKLNIQTNKGEYNTKTGIQDPKEAGWEDAQCLDIKELKNEIK